MRSTSWASAMKRLAALAEIPKQFPQSRWINDAKALQVEIQQAKGAGGASPESQSDEDLKVLAINALMNSEPERAIPLLEKVINDPKNTLGIKGRALFVLSQVRSDKAREIVAQYAKGGSNPDLQIRAVGYLGAFRSKESQQTLADVYAANTDIAVRRAVLRLSQYSGGVSGESRPAKHYRSILSRLRQPACRLLASAGVEPRIQPVRAEWTTAGTYDATHHARPLRLLHRP